MRSIDRLGLAASIAAVSASPGNTSPSTALFSHNVLPECTAGGSSLIAHDMHTALQSYCSTVANTVIHGPNHINSTLAVDGAPMAVTIEVCDAVDLPSTPSSASRSSPQSSPVVLKPRAAP